MNQVGEIKTFTLTGSPPFDIELAYVWRWWDGSVDTTDTPTKAKELNQGGTCAYSCVVADNLAQYQVYSGSIVVNAPPVVVIAPTVSENDTAFPYQTVITTKAYDPESKDVDFLWYKAHSGVPSGSTVNLSGTGTNTLARTISDHEKLTCYAIDEDLGTTKFDVFLGGYDPESPESAVMAVPSTLIANVANLPQVKIGPGQYAYFTGYAEDSTGADLDFQWAFMGTNGWSISEYFTGTTTYLGGYAYKNDQAVNVASESAGEKKVLLVVTNAETGLTTTTETSVELIVSATPTGLMVTTDAPLVDGVPTVSLSRNTVVAYTAVATDADGDLLSYKWTFTQPEHWGFDANVDVVMHGATVSIRPSDYTVFSVPGNYISGWCVVTDRFSKTSSVSIPMVQVIA